MTLKKLLIIFLVLTLCTALFAGCGAGKAGSNVPGNTLDANAKVVTVGDTSITMGEFQYYIYTAALAKAYSVDPTVADLEAFDWNQKAEFGKTLSEEIIKEAFDKVLYENIMISETGKNGIALSKEEKDDIGKKVNEYVEQAGEEPFLLTANANGINNKEDYKNLMLRLLLVQKAEEEITQNFDKYNPADADLTTYRAEDRVTAQHILITNESEKHSDPKATINEVLARAKAGEDFVALMDEYNEDPGATAAGYTFGPGEMVVEFEKAAFALNCGEISDVVKTEYGYHIIKRLVGLAELQQYWVANTEYRVAEDLISDISVGDIMKAAFLAQKQLQSGNK